MGIFSSSNTSACNGNCKACRKTKTKKIKDYNENSLATATPLKPYKIIEYFDGISAKVLTRLLELGLLKNKTIQINHISLSGAVLLVEINGYMLSLRREIANYIWVEGL